MCNIFTGWLHRKIKTDVFSKSRNWRLWNRASRLPVLVVGTCLEALIELSSSLALAAWEKKGSARPWDSSQLPCAVVTVKIKSGRKDPNTTQLFFISPEGVHDATLMSPYGYVRHVLLSYFRVLRWDRLWSKTITWSSITLIQPCQKCGACLILRCLKIAFLQLRSKMLR